MIGRVKCSTGALGRSGPKAARRPKCLLETSGHRRRRRFAVHGAFFFLENRENQTGSDDGNEPNELGLKHFLFAFEDVASEDAVGEPRLERDERHERRRENAVEEVHEGARKVGSTFACARGRVTNVLRPPDIYSANLELTPLDCAPCVRAAVSSMSGSPSWA